MCVNSGLCRRSSARPLDLRHDPKVNVWKLTLDCFYTDSIELSNSNAYYCVKIITAPTLDTSYRCLNMGTKFTRLVSYLRVRREMASME